MTSTAVLLTQYYLAVHLLGEPAQRTCSENLLFRHFFSKQFISNGTSLQPPLSLSLSSSSPRADRVNKLFGRLLKLPALELGNDCRLTNLIWANRMESLELSMVATVLDVHAVTRSESFRRKPTDMPRCFKNLFCFAYFLKPHWIASFSQAQSTTLSSSKWLLTFWHFLSANKKTELEKMPFWLIEPLLWQML